MSTKDTTKLPKGYHIEAKGDIQEYHWYYLGRQGGGKDYTSKKYFKKYEDAKAACLKYIKLKPKK